ncbi:MAG: choice-of-anchor L domain-containing protein [Saprospiraceae bacterium]
MKVLFYFLLLTISLNLQQLHAQNPINDDCNTAIALGTAPICTPLVYSNDGAKPTINVVSKNSFCSADGNNDSDVWFTFVTSSPSDYSITVKSTGPKGIIFPILGIYRGDCLPGGLVKICSDTSFVLENIISVNAFGLSKNETYFIRVSDEKGAGDFQICVSEYQPATIADSPSKACNGVLYDSGGPDKDYKDNENIVYTICPSEPHQCIKFTLVDYNLEIGDSLKFYNGPDTTAPLIRKIIGEDFNSGFNSGGSGFDVYATSNCMTLQFISDKAGVYEGFSGKWICSQEQCPAFKPVDFDLSPSNKSVEAAVARPGTLVNLKNINCGTGKFNYGTFNATDNSDLGLGTGIVLSSGDIRKINQSAHLLASTSLKLKGDNDLDSLSILEGGSKSKDACVVEFDVFANTDEINFEYIFGSEEYPEFISDPTFYDIFALLIDGPGIIGDPKISPKKNLAILPDGTPISIGQVNSSSNYQYYRNNFDGKEIVYNGLTIGKNGYRKTLSAQSKVIPCNTYHLKLAIADRGDENFDSGVFIGDIKGSAPEISFNSAIGLETLIENCSGLGEYIVFRLNRASNTALSYQVSFGGTATRNTDYQANIPNVITFPPGEIELSFPIQALNDNLLENQEYLEITLSRDFGCGLAPLVTYKVFIQDNLTLSLNFPDTLNICKNTIGAKGILLSASGANRYHWQTDSAFSTPFKAKTFINPSKDGWFSITGSVNACTVTDSFYVHIVKPELQIDTISSLSICEGGTIELRAVNNFGSQFLEWSPTNLFSSPNAEKVSFKPKFSGQITVKANIGTCVVADTIEIQVRRINMPVVDKLIEACYKEKIKLASFTFAPDSKFSWTPAGPSDPSSNDVFIQATQSEKYILKGESNNCVLYDTIQVQLVGKIDIQGADTLKICKGSRKRINADIGKNNSASASNFIWQSSAVSILQTDSLQTEIIAIKSGWIYAHINTAKCTLTDSIYVIVDSIPDNMNLIVVPAKPFYCQGDTILLYSGSMPLPLYPKATFEWMNPILGAASPTNKANLKFIAEKSSLYIRKINNVSCSRIDTFSILVLPKLPELELKVDTTCIGQIANLIVTNSSAYDKFEWKPAAPLSCSDCSNPRTTQAGTYTVTGSKQGFCPSIKSAEAFFKGTRLSISAVKSVFCHAEKVEAQLNAVGSSTVSWSPSIGLSCTNCTNPLATATGKFTVSTEKDGCKTSASIDIERVIDTVSIESKLTICDQLSTKVIIPNDSLFNMYSFSPAIEKNGNMLIFNTSGRYTLSAKTIKGNCPVNQTILVSKGNNPKISIQANPGIISLNQQAIKLKASGENLDMGTILWQDNSGGDTYTVTPNSATSVITIKGLSTDGCLGTDTITIYTVSIPTIFTPDIQGENSLLKILNIPPASIATFNSIAIFDRWGNLVFESNNADAQWNGNQYASDVYIYYLVFELNGTAKKILLKGEVTLVR